MKKLLLITSIACIVLFAGCKDNKSTETFCWDFNTTVVTSISGVSLPGYPKTVKSQTKQCGLTEEQAEQVVRSLTSTNTSTIQGIKTTIKTTCTKRKQ